MAMIPTIERPGIRSQFPRLNSYLKAYETGILEWEVELSNLNRYAKEGSGFEASFGNEGTYKYSFATAKSDLIRISNGLRWRAVHAALNGSENWQILWKQTIAYAYWHWRMELRTIEMFFADINSRKRMQESAWCSVVGVGDVVGTCLAFDWQDMAIDIAHRVYRVFDRTPIFLDDESFHPRTQHFVLRLIGNWQGWSEHKGPNYAFDEPIFNALVDNWRTPNPSDLVPLLLAACDRHTHQSRLNTAKQKYDLRFAGLWYDPFEVRTVLKLRQISGLEIPKLDHIIMNTPLGQLPDPTSPYSDELLEGVLARATKEYPNL